MHIGRNTVAVVTGASGGVGRATVRMLGDRGAKVVLLARGRDGLEGAKGDVESRGGRALAVPTDVSQFDQVQAAADAAEREFGPIDLWINNAMVSMYSPFMKMLPEEFRHIVEVTFLGNVYGTKCALQRMMPRDRGVIIQVGSALAFRSIPLQSAYCASKHAIQGFTESIRSELIHQKSNVRVSVVNMPALNTTQFVWTKNKMPHKARPTGTIFQPEVAAEAILFAAEHNRREIMVGYTTVEATLGVPPDGATMDFSACFQVYLGGQWHIFDSRHNIRRIGWILMATGRDAVDCAITTSFGTHILENFIVWADEVETADLSVKKF